MKLLALIALLLLSCCTQQRAPLDAPAHPLRVVSISPNLTEIIFAIGAEDRLVGNTEWCNFPEAAKSIARVGDYMSFNAEQTLATRPDAILLLAEHAHLQSKAQQLNLPTITFATKSVAQILSTITELGELLEHQAEASALRHSIETKIAKIRHQSADQKKPRVLLTIGRSMGSEGIDSVYCVGLKPFHNELIEIAGGVNACQINQSYPHISAEGILALNPDIIIDLLDSNATEADIETALHNWKRSTLNTTEIHIIAGDHTVVPGPRFILLLEQLAEIINGTQK